jgi:hypothetical protein
MNPEEMRNDLQNDSTFLYDEDGGEYEVKIEDIEFIKL